MKINDYLDYIQEIGKHNDIPSEHFDPEQLKKGIEIEKEHTDDTDEALSIAKDHLMEDPRYYDHLEDMEKKYKK